MCIGVAVILYNSFYQIGQFVTNVKMNIAMVEDSLDGYGLNHNTAIVAKFHTT